MNPLTLVASLGVSLLWGVQALWHDRWARFQGISQHSITVLTTVVNFVCILAYAYVQRDVLTREWRQQRTNMWFMWEVLGMVILTVIVANSLYYWILRQPATSVPVAITLMYTSPVFTWLFMRWAGGYDDLTLSNAWSWLGMACIVVGTAILAINTCA